MFDIGFSELFVIALVALLVLGPERLPRAARFAGLWVRRARAQWYSVKSELENELADDELKRSLLQTRDQLQDEMRQARDGLARGSRALRGEFGQEHAAPEPIQTRAHAPTPSDPDDTTPSTRSPERLPVNDEHDRR
jgi:sec-independent protein translocase protein TatB